MKDTLFFKLIKDTRGLQKRMAEGLGKSEEAFSAYLIGGKRRENFSLEKMEKMRDIVNETLGSKYSIYELFMKKE